MYIYTLQERLVKKQLSERPDLTPRAILVDGNGIMHVRRAGIATFLGVRTNMKTIGVGKKLYCCEGVTVNLVKIGVENRVRNALKILPSSSSTGFYDDSHECEKTAATERKTCLIMDRNSICAGNEEDEMVKYSERSPSSKEIQDMMEDLALIGCSAFAIKIKGVDGTVLGAALVGHGGGQITPLSTGEKKKRQRKKCSGTKNHIYISVGHNISLAEAVQICAELSFSRIPEPIRNADLSGRDWIRQQKKK